MPLIYALLLGLTMLVRVSKVTRCVPMVCLALIIKMYYRAVFLFTQSYKTVRPCGGTLVLLALLTMLAAVRFARTYARTLAIK